MKNNTNKFLKGMVGRFSATVMLLAMSCLATFADNTLKIEDFTIAPGQTKTLEILLDNEDKISSLEFIATLPEGLSYKANSIQKETSRITRSSHSIGVSTSKEHEGLGEGMYKFVVLSTSSGIENSPIKGNSGAIFTIDVVAANDYKGGVINVTDIIGSDQTFKVGDVYAPKRIDMESVEVKADVHVGDVFADAAELEVKAAEMAKVGVSLENEIELVGLQAVVTLPEGVSFVEDEQGEKVTYSNRLSGNVVATIEPLEGNKFTLVISSLTNDVFDGNAGNLFALNVATTEDFTEGDIVISDFKVSSVNGISYDLDDIVTTKIKNAPKFTDPTQNGIWDIDDVYAVLAVINNESENTYCDLNGDDIVDIDDVYFVLAEINK